jgi:hypothetical protein
MLPASFYWQQTSLEIAQNEPYIYLIDSFLPVPNGSQEGEVMSEQKEWLNTLSCIISISVLQYYV